MKPIKFKYANKALIPSGAEYSDNVKSVEPLYVWTDGEQCVSCWRPSWIERITIMLFGRVWLATLSGETQCPSLLTGDREYLREEPDK